MVKQFKKDPSRKKITREIPETETSKPKKTFNIDDFVEQHKQESQTTDNTKERKVGRPKKNKVYGTIRNIVLELHFGFLAKLLLQIFLDMQVLHKHRSFQFEYFFLHIF
ncbi:hypothetical protein ACTX2D_002591 [Enterococcus hirae]|uniref:hypothetical protein n=1 Tax=Enterococcus TaxID=1350 RepID=UPI001CF4081C|nr:hypothetical protein [Enterococcus hirae]MCA6767037.1 hypothetical protein [Enterococcus hirae]